MSNSEHQGGPPPEPKKKPRKSRAKKPAQAEPQAQAPPEPQPPTPATCGRILSAEDSKDVKWFMDPWFAYANVCLLIGKGGMGKSSMLAWVAARASRTLIFPGYEEEVEVLTLKRFLKNKVQLKNVRWMDDRKYALPRDQKLIIDVARQWEAELIIMDPVQSYMEPGKSENYPDDVRFMLESAFAVAKETQACLIGVRHPGKEKSNFLRGASDWRNVPKSIVLLKSDNGRPPKRWLYSEKNSFGMDPLPIEYTLKGKKGEAPQFLLGQELNTTLSELAEAASDPSERHAVLLAAMLIHEMFKEEQYPTVEDLVNRCKAKGIGDRPRREALRLLCGRSTPAGVGGKWIMRRLEKEWPQWLLDALK